MDVTGLYTAMEAGHERKRKVGTRSPFEGMGETAQAWLIELCSSAMLLCLTPRNLHCKPCASSSCTLHITAPLAPCCHQANHVERLKTERSRRRLAVVKSKNFGDNVPVDRRADELTISRSRYKSLEEEQVVSQLDTGGKGGEGEQEGKRTVGAALAARARGASAVTLHLDGIEWLLVL